VIENEAVIAIVIDRLLQALWGFGTVSIITLKSKNFINRLSNVHKNDNFHQSFVEISSK
jgi:hypothetical protein